MGTEVAAAALAVVTRRLGNDQRHFHRVTQANQSIAQLGAAVKSLDLVLQVAQLADGT